MYSDGFEIFNLLFSGFILVVAVVVLSSIRTTEISEEYESYEIESIREYYGSYGKKRIRVSYEGKEKSFSTIDINVDEVSHIRKYDCVFFSERLYLSPDDYNKYVGQYEAFEILEGE